MPQAVDVLLSAMTALGHAPRPPRRTGSAIRTECRRCCLAGVAYVAYADGDGGEYLENSISPEPTGDAERAIREAERILGGGQPDVFEILAKLEPHLGDQPAFRELVARITSLPSQPASGDPYEWGDLVAAQEMHVTNWIDGWCGRCGAGPTSVGVDPLYWRDTSGSFCTAVCTDCVNPSAATS